MNLIISSPLWNWIELSDKEFLWIVWKWWEDLLETLRSLNNWENHSNQDSQNESEKILKEIDFLINSIKNKCWNWKKLYKKLKILIKKAEIEWIDVEKYVNQIDELYETILLNTLEEKYKEALSNPSIANYYSFLEAYEEATINLVDTDKYENELEKIKINCFIIELETTLIQAEWNINKDILIKLDETIQFCKKEKINIYNFFYRIKSVLSKITNSIINTFIDKINEWIYIDDDSNKSVFEQLIDVKSIWEKYWILYDFEEDYISELETKNYVNWLHYFVNMINNWSWTNALNKMKSLLYSLQKKWFDISSIWIDLWVIEETAYKNEMVNLISISMRNWETSEHWINKILSILQRCKNDQVIDLDFEDTLKNILIRSIQACVKKIDTWESCDIKILDLLVKISEENNIYLEHYLSIVKETIKKTLLKKFKHHYWKCRKNNDSRALHLCIEISKELEKRWISSKQTIRAIKKAKSKINDSY